MGFGLFGKLPQKRDFIAVDLPSKVLHPFETWLQSAVAASRSEIGKDWENYYLVAPIWHFWLGPEVLGVPCAGSLMPSVDQVGRYFPLAILYVGEADETLPPPLLDPLDHWFHNIDQRLLAVLADDRGLDISQLLVGLEPPRPLPPLEPPAVVEEQAARPVVDVATIAGSEPEVVEEAPAVAESIGEAAPASMETPVEHTGLWDISSSTEPAAESADLAEPEEVEPGAPAEDAAAAVAETVPPKPRVAQNAFKGGMLYAVSAASVGYAAHELLDRDYRHAASGRSYWWCAASASGWSQMHARPGLPDPYFFSKMLLWAGK